MLNIEIKCFTNIRPHTGTVLFRNGGLIIMYAKQGNSSVFFACSNNRSHNCVKFFIIKIYV